VQNPLFPKFKSVVFEIPNFLPNRSNYIYLLSIWRLQGGAQRQYSLFLA